MEKLVISIWALILLLGCSGNEIEKNGFPVSEQRTEEDKEPIDGLKEDSLLSFLSRPVNS